jgi:hypothetical protein
MKLLKPNGWIIPPLAAAGLLTIQCPGLSDPINQAITAQEHYLALPLAKNAGEGANHKISDRYGIPFIEETLPIQQLGSVRVNLGGNPVKHIFLLGMTYAKPSPWAHPGDYSMRFFIGDELGRIRLDYADGSTQIFPLILGESIWFGKLFYEYPEPFSTDARFREALAEALRLYPPAPVRDGNYIAVITPKPASIRNITLEASPVKWGVPVINGITVELPKDDEIPGAVAFPDKALSLEFAKFASEKPLLSLGADNCSTPQQLNALRQALYTSDQDFRGQVAESAPRGYAGPEVTFKGNIFAEILANAFRYNVQDMAGKVDAEGMYHTSTKGSQSWGDYNGFGTFRTNVGKYYDASWSRDMGRSLQELTELGYTNQAARCADYCLRMARLWEEDPSLKFKGQTLPRHWGRIVNKPEKQKMKPFENDGHGLVTMFLYKLWQRLPDRNEWLRARWPDVKAAGDWILWQFEHPEISRATNGLLYTTGESAPPNGYSVYPDCVCMDALRALAQMADSIGETNSAAQWRDRADKMQKAITARYIVTDPKYGRVWTLDYAGFPDKTTVLGPLIFQADFNGFAPQDGNPQWRMVNEAAYRRLIDNRLPFGFYGRAMGYGQGFMSQAALLLDRMHDATRILDWAAKEIYDPKYGSFIVPEGCKVDPASGHFWFHLGDLGNGVQEAEIIKALRIVIGVDDTRPDRLQFYPRMPYDWKEMAADQYPVLFDQSEKTAIAHLNYKLSRAGDKMNLEISSDKELGPVAMRLGPFEKRPTASNVRVNGNIPAQTSIDHSGDSWWVKFTMPVAGVVESKVDLKFRSQQ